MNFNERGIDNERNESTVKSEPNQLPFIDGDDIFLKKKPVNLFITLGLFALALALSVGAAKHYYKKVNDRERLRWESGRVNKTSIDEANAKKHDLFQPLRQKWAKYISSEIEVKQQGGKQYFVVLRNKSPKALDRVEVSLYSLNRNGEAFNMKSLILKNVRPQETRRLKVDAGARSKEVLSLIKSIKAPSFSFCFDKDMDTGAKSDPYYCKEEGD